MSIALSPDGKKLASAAGLWTTANRAGEIKMWDVTTGKELASFAGHESMVHAVAISSDGKTLASAGHDQPPACRISPRSRSGPFWRGTRSVRALAFAPDGKTLLTGSWNPERTIKVWEVASGKELNEDAADDLRRHQRPRGVAGRQDGGGVRASGRGQNALGRFQVRDRGDGNVCEPTSGSPWASAVRSVRPGRPNPGGRRRTRETIRRG